jgi:excisionase family DNA binding protein
MKRDRSNQTGAPDNAAAKLLLTTKEASQALAVSEKTLFNHTKSGKIPVVRIGRSVRYDPEDLKAFVQQQKEAS